MYKKITGLVILVSVFMVTNMAYAIEGNVTPSVSNTEIPTNTEFDLPLLLDTGSHNVTSFTLTVNFDTAKIAGIKPDGSVASSLFDAVRLTEGDVHFTGGFSAVYIPGDNLISVSGSGVADGSTYSGASLNLGTLRMKTLPGFTEGSTTISVVYGDDGHVYDGGTDYKNAGETVTITIPAANTAPTIGSITGTTTPTIGAATHEYTATIGDGEDGSLSFWSVLTKQSDNSVVASTATTSENVGSVSISYAFQEAITYILSFFVQDSGSMATSTSLIITAQEAQDTTAPVLAVSTAVQTPTNNTTPTFLFTSTEAGTITYGGACVATTTNAINGINTITLLASTTAPYDFSEGEYSNCTITVTDTATTPNASTPLTIPTFTIDTTVPAEVDLSSMAISPINASSTASTSTTPTFSGSGEEGAIIIVSDGNGHSCTDTVAVGGAWSCQILAPTLSEGSTTFIITQADEAGNVSSTTTPAIIIDATAPEITLDPVVDGASKDVLVNEVYTIPDVTCNEANCIATSSQSGLLDTSAVTNTEVIYTVTDLAGNVTTRTVTFNVIAGGTPTIELMGGEAGTHAVTLEAGGTPYSEPGVSPHDAEDDDATLTATTTSNNININIVGDYTVSYSVTDSSGHTGTMSRDVHVKDTTIPTITLAGAVTIEYTATTTYTELNDATCEDINGTYTGACAVAISYPAEVVVGAVLPIGDHTITYTATDSDNTTIDNTASVTRTIHVVGDAPDAPTNLTLHSADTGVDGDNVTSNPNLSLTVSCAPGGSVLKLYNNSVQIATSTCGGGISLFSNIEFIAGTTAAPDGTYILTAKTEVGGISSEASTAITVKVDTSAPGIGASISPSSTEDTTPTLSISVSDTNGVDAVTIGGVTASCSGGTCTATMPSMSVAQHSVTVIATDLAGNQRTESKSFTITAAAPSGGGGGGGGGGGNYTPTTYSWSTGNWEACVNGVQIRRVRCKSNKGMYREDSRCKTTKPVVTQACGANATSTATTTVTESATTTQVAATTTPAQVQLPVQPLVQLPVRPLMMAGLPTAQCPHFTQNFRLGGRGEEVFKIQTFLKSQGYYNGLIGGYYGPLTKHAVEQFQARYSNDILQRVGLVTPSGNWFSSTQSKANDIAGCSNVWRGNLGMAQVQLPSAPVLPTIAPAGQAAAPQNVSVLQATINSLLSQVRALQQQLAGMLGGGQQSATPQQAPAVPQAPAPVHQYGPTQPVAQQYAPAQSANTLRLNDGNNSCPYFTGNYYPGARGEGVRRIQLFLKWRGIYNGLVGGYYGPLTERAVRDFQARNPEILRNAGIYTPTGRWYASSRTKASQLIGCGR